MNPFPWGAAMQFGLGVLRLPPQHFWGLTPRELAAAFEALSGRARGVAPPRGTLDALMEKYPDGR
jgi:uncharacterized phage protein (TIGR02216 family)